VSCSLFSELGHMLFEIVLFLLDVVGLISGACLRM
jgi:hypothetical protein